MRSLKSIFIGAALTLVAGIVVTLPAQAADKVVLMLNWYVYGEHAPFFYGLEKGYYKAEGIDLDIQEGRGSGITTQAVAAKSVTFGYVDVPTMMRAAVKGAPVTAIGVLLQKTPMSVMGFVDKNIRKPNDIKGKIVAMTPGGSNEQIWPLFLKKVGLKEFGFPDGVRRSPNEGQRRDKWAGRSCSRLSDGSRDEDSRRHWQARLPDKVCRLRHSSG